MVTEAVENMLKVPSSMWKARIKEVVQAARQDERQKLLKRFVRERQKWEATRAERKDIGELKEELKRRDIKLSWMQNALSERENMIRKLKEDKDDLERQLENDMNDRLQNAEAMKKLLLSYNTPVYPGIRVVRKPETDPYKEVSMHLFEQHKILEQHELNNEMELTETPVPNSPFSDSTQSTMSFNHDQSTSTSSPMSAIQENSMDTFLSESFLRD